MPAARFPLELALPIWDQSGVAQPAERSAVNRNVVGSSPTPGAAMRSGVTVAELERWELHGAIWRALEVTDRRAVVELCSCTGEPVDVAESDSPAVIEFVRERDAD